LVATAALGLLPAASAQGAITVANTNDSGPGSLRQAIADAPPGETIDLPAGTYTLTSGPLEIGKSLTIVGHDDADTKVSGGHASRVFEIDDGDVTMVGITISDGLDDEGENASAGGIQSFANSLTLREVTVSDNVADADGAPGFEAGYAEGGGILSAAGAKLALIDSVVTRNKVTAVGGAGQNGYSAEGGGISASGPLEIVNSRIVGNVVDARGGQGPSSPEQDGGSVNGAGLSTYQNEPYVVTVSGSTISGNVADASAGPGGEAGYASAAGWSEVANDSEATIANTTIAANAGRALGPDGKVVGAAYLRGGDPGKLVLLGSTIAANVAEVSPGGEVDGRNLVARQLVTIGNTIVADPSGTTAPGSCLLEEGATSLGFNIDGTDECGFHAVGDRVNTDPQLGPLQDNGGPTQTMAPAGSSPAVDQGTFFGALTDQRGVIRPIDFPTIANPSGGNGADIGAVELQPSNAVRLGKLKKNRKRGTATLKMTVPLPSAGTIVLQGKGLKKQVKTIAGQASLKLKVIAKGKVRKALRKKGKRKVAIKVTYAPTGNAPAIKTRKTKLVRK
jgi:hypothetical protein